MDSQSIENTYFFELTNDPQFLEIKDYFFVDRVIRETYTKDFGHMANYLPTAVFVPERISQLQAFVKLANRYTIKIICRGRAHSMNGQALCDDGVILDLKKIDENLESLNSHLIDKIIVPAHVTWQDVVSFTLKSYLTVPVLTDYLGLSIGGTLSVGGLGGSSYLKGSQADNILSLDILTPEGNLLTCSKDQNSEFYQSVLCGLGQMGIILRATLPLIELKPNVKLHLLSYSDQNQFLFDQAVLYQRQDCDHLKGFIRKKDERWQYVIEVAFFQKDNAENEKFLEGLCFENIETSQMSYHDFVMQVTSFVDFLSLSQKLEVPHPWYNALLPEHEISEHLNLALNNPYLTGVEPIIVYPINAEKIQQKYFADSIVKCNQVI